MSALDAVINKNALDLNKELEVSLQVGSKGQQSEIDVYRSSV